MRVTFALPILLAVAAPLAAQGTRPADWRVRYDRAGVADTAMKLDQMGPGWHIYTSARGSGIAWRPAVTASGNFKAEADTYMFPSAGHMDGYGIIVGGRDLDSANQSYTYFLIRRDGQYLIKHRAGTQVHDVVPWTPHAAITQPTGDQNVKQVLAVEAGRDSVNFLINGQRVHSVPRSGAQVDGIVGLRVNHGLSVHVNHVRVTPQ